MTLESPQQAVLEVQMTWTRRKLGLEMAGSILNLWVQQQRMWGFTEKKMHKKKNMANRKNTNQTAKKKQRNKIQKQREIQVLSYFGFYVDLFFLFFVFLVILPVSLFIWWICFWFCFCCFFSVVLLKSTFSVPVGLIILNHSMILLHLLPGTTKVCDAKVLFQQRKNLARHPEIICMSVRVCMNMI